MNRFDIGVVVVTFVALGLIAIIRSVIAPLVRYRVGRYRLESRPMASANLGQEHRHEVEDATQ
jgi:membrane protein YdbS with pleckstrin-like domain